jgi:hypothetical protein
VRFRVVDSNSQILPNTSGSWEAWLVRDNWDDFHFKTSFGAVLVGPDQDRLDLGGVKIANRGMPRLTSIQLHPLPKEFTRLDDTFYSLGQGVEYYEALRSLPGEIRAAYLYSIRDVAFTTKLVHEFITENAFQKSLLRAQNPYTVVTQYHRISHGGPTHEAFAFEYRDGVQPPMRFDVRPASSPPTNVHVLIGSNGVGKTRLLETFERLIRLPSDEQGRTLQFVRSEDGTKAFSNLGVIAYSAFDSFGSNANPNSLDSPKCHYFGLKKHLPTPATPMPSANAEVSIAAANTEGSLPTYTHKTVEDLVSEFKSQLGLIGHRSLKRFSDSLRILSSDPLIEASRLAKVCANPPDFSYATVYSDELATEFRAMSSGHKIVLLAIAGSDHPVFTKRRWS